VGIFIFGRDLPGIQILTLVTLQNWIEIIMIVVGHLNGWDFLNELFIKLIFYNTFLVSDYVSRATDRDYFGKSITVIILLAVAVNLGKFIFAMLCDIIETIKKCIKDRKDKAKAKLKTKKVKKVKKAPKETVNKPDETVVPDAIDQNLEVVDIEEP
jgi:hypothetical protein